MSAPNWDQGHVLTWSGKWHIMRPAFFVAGKTEQRAYCGAYGYTKDTVPCTYRLLSIRNGPTQAPICKKCQRAQAKEAGE